MNDPSYDSRSLPSQNFSATDASVNESNLAQSDLAQSETLSGVPTAPDWNYEATVAEVESIINRIEMGDLELAEVFDQFAIAVTHLHQCETFLAQKKRQMDVLIETLSDNSEAF